MSSEADQLDEYEVAFEAAMVNASTSQLFEFGEGLGVDNFTAEMRKSEKMAALRTFVQKSWGDEVADQLAYMKSLHQTLRTFKMGEPRSPYIDTTTLSPQINSANTENGSPQYDTTTTDGLYQRRMQDERDRSEFGGQNAGLYQSNQQPPIFPPSLSPPHGGSAEEAAGQQMFSLIRSLADANIAQRRQLKIIGVIGDAKDSRSINYINLMSQVADAKVSKYKDDEIAIAIKKSISASSHLRTYFDAAEKMELDKMLGMLRDFYQEKSASELFAELGQLCQNSQEKSTDFLLRAMQVRQRTTAAALAEGDLYNNKLVQSTFVRAVETGLREESIRAQLAPHLVPGKPADDSVMLREVNKAELKHEETTKKQKLTTPKKVAIAQATTSAPTFDEALKPILEGMSRMQQRLDDMQSGGTPTTSYRRNAAQDASDGRDRRPPQGRKLPSYRAMCRRCRRDGVSRCWHCFECGEEGHQASECTSTSKNQNWSMVRDGQ